MYFKQYSVCSQIIHYLFTNVNLYVRVSLEVDYDCANQIIYLRRRRDKMRKELKIISLSEIKTEEVKWLWYPYIPFGKVTIV